MPFANGTWGSKIARTRAAGVVFSFAFVKLQQNKTELGKLINYNLQPSFPGKLLALPVAPALTAPSIKLVRAPASVRTPALKGTMSQTHTYSGIESPFQTEHAHNVSFQLHSSAQESLALLCARRLICSNGASGSRAMSKRLKALNFPDALPLYLFRSRSPRPPLRAHTGCILLTKWPRARY